MKNTVKKAVGTIVLVGGIIVTANYLGHTAQGLFSKGIELTQPYASVGIQEKEVDKKAQITLVNKYNGLDKEFEPSDLVVPNIKFNDNVDNEAKQISGVMAKPLEDMVNTAEEEGIILLGNSGYRSYESQVQTYKNRVNSVGKEQADAYVAQPGYSEHQTGLSIDITNPSKYFAKGTKEADWLADNAHKFGFIIRYPEGAKKITGVEYEPWHIRYVGTEVAKDIYEQKITLEEYLNKV